MTRHVKPLDIRLDSEPAERSKRAHAEAISKLQDMPAAAMEVVSDAVLKNGTTTPVAHPLGRLPKWVGVSAVRNATSAGVVIEVRDGSYDRTKYVALKATGFGADITVDLAVL